MCRCVHASFLHTLAHMLMPFRSLHRPDVPTSAKQAQRSPMKMIQGCSLLASEKIARTSRLASPNHLDIMLLAVMFKK